MRGRPAQSVEVKLFKAVMKVLSSHMRAKNVKKETKKAKRGRPSKN